MSLQTMTFLCRAQNKIFSIKSVNQKTTHIDFLSMNTKPLRQVVNDMKVSEW